MDIFCWHKVFAFKLFLVPLFDCRLLMLVIVGHHLGNRSSFRVLVTMFLPTWNYEICSVVCACIAEQLSLLYFMHGFVQHHSIIFSNSILAFAAPVANNVVIHRCDVLTAMKGLKLHLFCLVLPCSIGKSIKIFQKYLFWFLLYLGLKEILK